MAPLTVFRAPSRGGVRVSESRSRVGHAACAPGSAAALPTLPQHRTRRGLTSAFAGTPIGSQGCRRSGVAGESCIRPSASMSASAGKWAGATPPEIVILGGGFGGLYTALRLDSLEWPEGGCKPRVTLVDQGERFLFKPLMYELLNGEMKAWEVAPLISEILAPTSVRFVQAQASLVVPSEDGDGGSVELADGQQLSYDYLVLALGAKTVMDAAPGAQENAMPFSTLEDAIRLNEELDDLEARGRGVRVVVVGGGYAGVEMASVLGERLSGRGSVQIVTPGKRIMEGANDGQREASERALRERGVKVVAGGRVSSVGKDEDGGDGKTVRVSVAGAGERAVACDLVVWTAGQRPALEEGGRALAASFLTSERGEVVTEPTLRVRGSRRAFAVGDATAGREKGEPLPATAQVALQQADFCAWNLWCDINGRAMLPFRYQHLGSLMTLGRADAALALPVGGVTLDGPLGQLARKAVYLYRQPTLEHRLKVGASWLARPVFQALGQSEPELEKAMDALLDAVRRLDRR